MTVCEPLPHKIHALRVYRVCFSEFVGYILGMIKSFIWIKWAKDLRNIWCRLSWFQMKFFLTITKLVLVWNCRLGVVLV